MASTDGKHGRNVAYGSADFQSASEFVRLLEARRDRPARVLGSVLRRPRELLRAIHTIRRLPVIEVRLTDAPNGRAIREELEERSLAMPLGRVARAALELPDDFDSYLRGRSRQAVRTNLTRARELGIVCRPLEDPVELAERSKEMVDLTGSDPRDAVPSAERREFYLAEQSGEPLAIGVIATDAETAYLAFMKSQQQTRASGFARYALSIHLIRRAIECGAKVLVVHGGTLWMPAGLQYFQHRLGFRPHNIRIKARAAPSSVPRRFARQDRNGARRPRPERVR